MVIVMILMTCFIPTATADKEETEVKDPALLGDLDGNDSVNAADASLLLRHIVKLQLLNTAQLSVADCNKDGSVTAADATAILRYVVKLDSIPPTGGTVTMPPFEATPDPYSPTGFDGVIALAKVDANELRLREGPGEAYPVITMMTRDMQLYIFANDASGWSYVQIKGTLTKGWAFTKYLKLTNQLLAAYGKLPSEAPLYKTYSLTGGILATLPANTSVGIIGAKDTFYLVRLLDSGIEGYVLKTAIPVTTSLAGGPTPTPTPPPTPTPNGLSGVTAEGVVKGDKVHLRSDAGSEFTLVKTLAVNTPLYIFEKKTGVSTATIWYHVQVKGESTEGWILSDYVTLTTARIIKRGTVNVGEVSLRKSATTTSDKVGSPLVFDTAVGILEEKMNSGNDLWYRVRVLATGLEGWVRATNITVTELVP